MKNIIIFGTGEFYQRSKSEINNCDTNIIAFLDNDVNRIGSFLDGKPIMKPNDIVKMQYDQIIIMSVFAFEMKEQLLSLGAPEEKIYCYQIYNKTNQKGCHIYYPDNDLDIEKQNDIKKILLITHDLSLTGAPIVVHYAAKALKENGYYPVIYSPTEGPLIDDILKDGITVIVDGRMSIYNWHFKKIVEKFDAIIVNTLVLYGIIDQFKNLNKPVFWWLHEGYFAYRIFKNSNTISKNISENINIYAVGIYAQRHWENFRPSKESKVLLYGIPDKFNNDLRMKPELEIKNNKIIFSIVGTIDKRKGQDIFVKAISLIPKEYRCKAEFWIVGKKVDREFCEELEEASKEISEIKFIEEMSRDEVMDIYKGSDVIVCTSRDDPMPVVLTEGMMFNKTFICSSNTGTASFVKNGCNGFVYDNEDYIELSEQIMMLINNPKRIYEMGNMARKIYEENFEYSVFSKNITNEIAKILKKQ